MDKDKTTTRVRLAMLVATTVSMLFQTAIGQPTGYAVIGQNDNYVFSVSRNSLQRDGDTEFVQFDMRVEARSTSNLPKTARGTPWSIVDLRSRVDCTRNQIFELDVYYRDRNGTVLEEMTRTKEIAAPMQAPPGSFNAIAMQWACSNAPHRPHRDAKEKDPGPSSTPPQTAASTDKEDETKGRSSGTGFVVSTKGHLLTNNHVVRRCTNVDMLLPTGETVSGRVLARDSRNDLALIQSARMFSSVASFRKSPIRSGENVIALGYPYRGLLAADVNVSVGIVSAMAGIRNDTSQLQISAPVQPGNSGGPLLDQAGAVAGVVVAKLDALEVAKAVGDIPQNVNFAIKGELAQAFLRSHDIEPRSTPETARSSPVAELVQIARGYTFLVECDPRKEARAAEERAAAEKAEHQQRERERHAEAERAEAEKKALARQRAEEERAAVDSKLRFALPVRCEFGRECRVIQYFDHGSARDYACGSLTVAGYIGVAFAPSPDSQDRTDIPVVAAAPGRITAASASGIQIDHGGGWTTKYVLDTTETKLRAGIQVDKGQVIGRMTPAGKFKIPQLVFIVVKDGFPIDPFRPVKGSGCGLATDSRWEPEAVRQLVYDPLLIVYAGFAEGTLDLKKAQQGEFTVPVSRSTGTISFWVGMRGTKQGDKFEVWFKSPSGDVLATGTNTQDKDEQSWIVRIQRVKILGDWDVGEYTGELKITRDGAEILRVKRKLSLK